MTEIDPEGSTTRRSRWKTLSEDSAVVNELVGLRATLAETASNARTVTTVRQLREWTEATPVTETSRVATGGRQLTATLQRWVTSSWGYQWLTAEPDPEIIVIDLRKTYTVGPLIAGIDRLYSVYNGASKNAAAVRYSGTLKQTILAAPLRISGVLLLAGTILSILTTILTGAGSIPIAVAWVVLATGGLLAYLDRRSWAALRETRGYNWLVAAFAPPEPPVENDAAEMSHANIKAKDTERSVRNRNEKD